jgi:hypothetical protein
VHLELAAQVQQVRSEILRTPTPSSASGAAVISPAGGSFSALQLMSTTRVVVCDSTTSNAVPTPEPRPAR